VREGEAMKAALIAMALAACGHAAAPIAQPPGDSHAGPPSCDAIVSHLAIVFGQHDLAPDDREQLVASCDKDDPPPVERACVMAAQTPAEIDACGKSGPRPEPGTTTAAPAPPPIDPREDLVALGERVARYRVELGEPPPVAGPTPAAGACCAAPCPADVEQWTGPWQLVRFGLDHATRWSFAIERPDDGSVRVRALGCPGAKSYSIVVAPGATPTAADVTED
jgi:hypothetical protein